MPALFKQALVTNKTPKVKTTNLSFLPKTSLRPSRFKYLAPETISIDKPKTKNKKTKGKAAICLFLNMRIKEASIPPLAVVGNPEKKLVNFSLGVILYCASLHTLQNK